MKLSDLDDPVELNRQLAADPALRDNMREMGFIKPVPFMRDHNEQHETQFMLTDHGRQEMRRRFLDCATFELSKGTANDG